MTDLKEGIARNVAQTSVWKTLRIASFVHHYHDRDIKIEGLELRHSGTDGALLLADGNLQLHHGHVYGLIGRNGVGKTTLMRHIAEHRILGLPAHLRCVYIDDESHQIGLRTQNGEEGYAGDEATIASGVEADAKGLTVLQYLLDQHKAQIAARRALKDALEADEEVDIEALQEACDLLATLEADKAEARAVKILQNLDMDPNVELQTLSGGWLHRASLAAALFVESDVLLLDEPTNHLDIHGIAWLEQFLQSQSEDQLVEGDSGKGKAAKKGNAAASAKNKKPIIVVISHDFSFLDNVCTNVICFEQGTVDTFAGNYSRYLETKQAKLQKHERMYKAQEKRRRTMDSAIEKLQQKATANPTLDLGGQIKARQKTLKSRLGTSLDGTYWKYGLMGPRPEILAPIAAEPIEFVLETDVSDVPESSGKGETLLVRLEDGGFRYGAGKEALNEDGTVNEAEASRSMFGEVLNISVTLSSRIALVGRNGTGKSTILKLLAGELPLTNGDRLSWEGLRVSFLSQHSITSARSGELGTKTPIEYIISQHSTTAKAATAVKSLQRFGIIGELAERSTLSNLSAGQRARVLLASALFDHPHVLLLDEPTSHLDAETSSALSVALDDFEGAVIVASHDVSFIENLGGALFCTDPELFGWYEQPLATYHNALLVEKRKIDRQMATAAVAASSSDKKKPQPKSASLAAPSAAPVLAPTATATPKTVGCRHCGGDHFSHSCPERPEDQKKGILMPENYDPNAWRYENQKPKPKVAVALPKMTEKAKDGQGDWKVAVDKSTLKRLKKGIQ